MSAARKRVTPGSLLPQFPWDSLTRAKATAAAHEEGMVNLSVGTPVDEVASIIRQGLSEGAAAPGYPQTVGTPELRAAIVAAMARRYGVTGLESAVNGGNVLPVIGTKEAIGWLPFLLGVGAGHTVVIPELAYPTYEVGVRIAGAELLRADSLTQIGPASPTLMFINSPGNPNGKVLGVEHLRKVVEWARARDVIVASDECYLGLGWTEQPVSILDPRVCDGDFTNLLAIHSLSKTSNMASYRTGWFAGDADLIAELVSVRRHMGLMMPGPIQHATIAALNDDSHEAEQKQRYSDRREILRDALVAAGFRVDDSEGGLYLWVTRGEDCWQTVDWLAERGILVAPGSFYGPKGAQHVRVGLTATLNDIEVAAARIRG
ncbi:succinyldiaminopimelate transaminase [Corynebacterium amycolatum]|uniref:Succinyldiaminopimelate transaminase n=1 Tax=Corynebacterium amycolatum TaxID=43765 RepID=A0AB37G5Y8_CORAY|nr:succinyldiaminopimelate transaminase [Corynebacterium amycolatum]QPR30049.1 succinyldiaminopimelate transaminase [Corynebacterium amycolatum]QQB81888.1 succinyldiaminopimelate transaminase [Corynebacterium amycolatum]QQU99484.1 succinyldiaminopimelate transaminase [Corynebacterium amycolatum]STB94449.1 N-succinyldiaminopimelate aminotransferase [Corynebacterium amycolatum]